MGNATYRPTPRRIFNSEEGCSHYYDYGANQITGWRCSQEDRYICLPNFHPEFGYFAVYDGHGGEDIVQYIQRYLHQSILYELNERNDPEMALFLGFDTCEMNMRNVTKNELSVIEKDLVKEFEIPDKAERRQVIADFGNLIAANSAGTSKDSVDSSSELKSATASTCLSQLPSVLYLTKAPLEESDESDRDYDPDDDIEDSEGSCEESKESSEESEDSFEESEGNSTEEQVENENCNKGVVTAENTEQYTYNEESENEENNENVKNTGPENNSGHCEMDIPNEPIENRGNTNSKNMADRKRTKNKSMGEMVKKSPKDKKQKFGEKSGSTATVVLVSRDKIYVANVGDSRCVACINGHAVQLSVDHKPTDKEESIRITDAGASISLDGRINGELDMSRAFGDFELKEKEGEDIYQVLSTEPTITTVNVTTDLEFIIIASDGIWNALDSSSVVNYFRNRMQEQGMELRDICGELFEDIIAPVSTSEGIGCDNMTAIVIRFKNPSEKICTRGTIYEKYKYFYPPVHKHIQNMPETNDDPSTKQQTIQPNQDCEEIMETEKHVQDTSFCNDEAQVAAYPFTSGEQEQSDDQDDIENLVEPIPGCQASSNQELSFGPFPVYPVPNSDYTEQVPTFQMLSGAHLEAPLSGSQMSMQSRILNNNESGNDSDSNNVKELNMVIENLISKVEETNNRAVIINKSLGHTSTYLHEPGSCNYNEEEDDDDVVIIADIITAASTITAVAATASVAADVAATTVAAVSVAATADAAATNVAAVSVAATADATAFDSEDYSATVVDRHAAVYDGGDGDPATYGGDGDLTTYDDGGDGDLTAYDDGGDGDLTTYDDGGDGDLTTYDDDGGDGDLTTYDDGDGDFTTYDDGGDGDLTTYGGGDAAYYVDGDGGAYDNGAYHNATAMGEHANAVDAAAAAAAYDAAAAAAAYNAAAAATAAAAAAPYGVAVAAIDADDDDDVVIIDDFYPNSNTRTENRRATTSNESGDFERITGNRDPARKRTATAENSNTVTKKMKTDDHTIPNAEKHK